MGLEASHAETFRGGRDSRWSKFIVGAARIDRPSVGLSGAVASGPKHRTAADRPVAYRIVGASIRLGGAGSSVVAMPRALLPPSERVDIPTESASLQT